MAMSNVEQNFVSNTSRVAKALLDLYGDLAKLNVLWAGAPGYNVSITQADIDSVASFFDAALTTGTLADVEFALASVLTLLQNALPALTVLATLP